MKKRIYPPSYLNLLLIPEIALHWILPIQQIFHPPITYLGIILILISLVVNVYSVRYLERKNTASSFLETASNLVISGPFARSRNPIYLSGILISLGIAILLGSLITFFIPIVIFLILNFTYIPDEEHRLEKKFGEQYLVYKKNVRRWI